MTSDISAAQPKYPGDNSISKLEAALISNSRVNVTVYLHEGNDRPNLSISLVDSAGEFLARSFIISCIDLQIDFTLHIRKPQPIYPLTVHCESFFEDDKPVDQKDYLLEQPVP